MSYLETTINNRSLKLIPVGECACGCGKKTTIKHYWPFTVNRFVCGHNIPRWKGGIAKHSNGYVCVYEPDHPRADSRGYVMEHILVCEKALGKFLPEGAIPHHVNKKKSDNRNKNLVLCQNLAYHNLIHARENALQACGNPHWTKCVYCKQYDDPQNMSIHAYNHGKYLLTYCHPTCRLEYRRKRVKLVLRLPSHETEQSAG